MRVRAPRSWTIEVRDYQWADPDEQAALRVWLADHGHTLDRVFEITCAETRKAGRYTVTVGEWAVDADGKQYVVANPDGGPGVSVARDETVFETDVPFPAWCREPAHVREQRFLERRLERMSGAAFGKPTAARRAPFWKRR